MPQRTRAQRLNGLFPLSYLGVVPVSPGNFIMDDRPPTINDSKNFYIGDLWLNTTSQPPTASDVWILVSLVGNNATWVNFGAGNIETLTGNSGGPVGPDGADNINVVGDGVTIDIVGNPGTNTLTATAIGTGVMSSLTGDSGGPVFPTAGNTNIFGTTNVITVTGNPGTSTLTIDAGPDIATSYITNPATGTAVPAAGVLTFAGAGGVVTSAAGSTVTITGSGGTLTTLHSQDGNNVTPTAGVINVSGSGGLTTTGTAGPNTLTVTLSPIPGFAAYKTANSANVTGDGSFFNVIFDTEIFDTTSNYNNGTGVFTAPITGIYHFDTYVQAFNITDQTLGSIFIVTTTFTFETDLQSPVNDKQGDNLLHYQVSVTTSMTAGDTAYIQLSLGGGTGAKTVGVGGQAIGPIASYFGGHLVH